jgi:hypothetical protein
MGNIYSRSYSTGGNNNGKEAFGFCKGATKHRQNKKQMIQNVLLIWLDSNISDENADSQNTIATLRSAVNTIRTYTDSAKCIEFIKSVSHEKACMLILGSVRQNIVPRIHNMSQVDSIFIFCNDQAKHEQWAKEWPKIKGVFTGINQICEVRKQAAKQCEQNSISISMMATNGDISKKKLRST